VDTAYLPAPKTGRTGVVNAFPGTSLFSARKAAGHLLGDCCRAEAEICGKRFGGWGGGLHSTGLGTSTAIKGLSENPEYKWIQPLWRHVVVSVGAAYSGYCGRKLLVGSRNEGREEAGGSKRPLPTTISPRLAYIVTNPAAHAIQASGRHSVGRWIVLLCKV
jgi:hypothetical protein